MDLYNCTEGVFPVSGADGGGGATDDPKPPPHGKILLTLALSAVAAATTAINSLVITAIAVTRKLHHPANYLICSLAVTDLLVAVLVMPFSIVYIQQESWAMGQPVCDLWLSMDVACCTCSILHLAAIAVDRYRAITDAVEYARKRTGLRAGLTVAVVWILAALISLPPLLWRQRGSPDAADAADDDAHCMIAHHHMAFTLYSTLGAFYIPLLLILILYYKIYRAAQMLYLRREASRSVRCAYQQQDPNGSALPSALPGGSGGSSSPLPHPERYNSDPSTESERVVRVATSPRGGGEWRRERRERTRGGGGAARSLRERSLKQQQRISGSRERKAATTLGLVLGAFVVCWLPFFLKEVIVNTCDGCSISGELSDFLTWLGYLNSLINPLIYTIFNQDFKKAFQRLFKCRHYL